MKNKLSVKQNGFKDCAAACLLSIVRYYNGNLSKEEINYLIKTDAFGTNAYNLIEGAKLIGFDGYGLKVNFNELIKYETDFPVIAHTKKSNMYHYVVIYNITKKYLKIMDPEYGIKKVSYEYFKSIYLSTIIVLRPIKSIPKLKSKDKIFKSVVMNLITNKKYIGKIIILSLLITILSIIINFYLKVYIDYIYVNFSLKLLISITSCFLIIIFLKSIFDNIRSKILSSIKSNISSNITNDSIKHIMHLPYQYFKNKPSGEVISRIEDLENFKELTSAMLLNIFVNIFLLTASIIVLYFINKTLFLLSVCLIIVYSIIVIIYSFLFKNKIYNIQISDGEYKKELVEIINGYETFKNLNLINEITHKIKIKYNSLLNKIKEFEHSLTNQYMIKSIISEGGMILISSVGLFMVNKKMMSIGDVVAFTSLVLFFTEPIKELLDLIPSIRYAINSYERINDLLLIESEVSNNMDKQMIDGNIIIKDLTYSHNNYDNTFENVNIKIKKGSKFLIHGKSGSGKSTLIKILLKYINNYNGTITINNINLKDIDNDIIKNSICYISQNEILLSDTIKNNIMLSRNISIKAYSKVIEICNVNKIIDDKALRGDFLIEENGFNLSGGERQKIILARGLLKTSKILILDEALSEVGFEEEKKIIEGIFKKFDKNTIIYISHKKEIIELFENKYYFLKKGEKHVRKR